MENGSFQAPFSEISNLEFQGDSPSVQLPPLPTEVPTRKADAGHFDSISHTQSPFTKSSTIEALINQNEDLTARLKVSLRRLSFIENENDSLRIIEHEFKTQNSSLSDQLLIWQEKESFWQKKNANLELQMKALKARFPELEDMEDKIERYRKYHEKIKLQVKPYIQQLKALAQDLTLEVRKLHQEIDRKETLIEKHQGLLQTAGAQFLEEKNRHAEELGHLAQAFETEKHRWSAELAERQELMGAMVIKGQRLDAALMRQDELENTIIALTSAKERTESQLDDLRETSRLELQTLKKAALESRLELEEFRKKETARTQELSRQTHRADQLEEQLSSMRFIWKSKSDEASELQMRLESLEKLNQELSHRLNQARKGEASL